MIKRYCADQLLPNLSDESASTGAPFQFDWIRPSWFWPSFASLPERLARLIFPFSIGDSAYKTSKGNLTDLFAEILDDYHTVAVAELDVDDRGVLVFPILVGLGGNLTSVFVVEQSRSP